jgi:hypothetical protein
VSLQHKQSVPSIGDEANLTAIVEEAVRGAVLKLNDLRTAKGSREPPIAISSSLSIDKGERNKNTRKPRRGGTGSIVVVNPAGELKRRQKHLFASRAPSENSVDYQSRLDTDAEFMYLGKGTHTHEVAR